MEIEHLVGHVRATDSDDALMALEATAHASGELERVTAVLVRRARNQGASWAQIATSMGVSKQAVHKKYGGARLFGSQP